MKNDGGVYTISGYGSFSAPLHVIRLDHNEGRLHGWQVRLPKKVTVFFSDGIPRNPQAALDRANAYVVEQGFDLRYGRQLPKTESVSKQHRTGVVGVYLQRRERNRNGRIVVSYSFLIPRPDKKGPCRTVYIGSESTWQQKYQARLAVAAEIRAEFELEFEQAYARAG